jgi:hypothetical protein
MTMKNESTARRAGWLRAVVLLGIGAVLGSIASDAFRSPAPLFPAALFAQDGIEQVGGNEEGDYLFFTFRRNLWVVHKPTGRVQFLMFPDGSEQQLVRSRIHQVDQSVFPTDQVRYQLSERNLTNFLWILNPVTGKARFIRAGRDGGFETSEIESVARREG